MLKKFGGKLSLEEFYGNSGSSFKCVLTPPFVTFAIYAELTNKTPAIDTKALTGLRRPDEAQRREIPRMEQEMTEKPPMILEFLARRGAMKPPQIKSDEPSKKKTKTAQITDEVTQVSEGAGGLAKYLMKS
jgi:hypothetical protein